MRMLKKPLRTQGVFIDFASSRFLNRDLVIREVRKAVEAVKTKRCDVKEIYLFGSFASGIPTPRSDLDLLIVADTSAEDLIPSFISLPVPVDLHVVAPASFLKGKKAGKGIVGEAVRRGLRLL